MNTVVTHIFSPFGQFIIRLGLGVIFIYFGGLALMQPQDQAVIWIMEPFAGFVNSVMPLYVFMIIFGVIEVLIGIAVIFRVWIKIFSFAAFLLLIGVVVNLSFGLGFLNDIVMRDVALALVALGIFLNEIIVRKAIS